MGRKRVLEVKLISAQGLRTSARIGKPRTYAAAWIQPSKRLYTQVDDEGGCDPAWDDKLWLPIEDYMLQADSSSAKLTIEIFQRGHVHDHPVGVVEVPLKDVASDLWKPQPQFLAFPVRRPSGRTRGVLNLSLKLREQSHSRSSSSSSESSSDSESERRRRQSAAPAPPPPPPPASYPPAYSARATEYPSGTTGYPSGYPSGYPAPSAYSEQPPASYPPGYSARATEYPSGTTGYPSGYSGYPAPSQQPSYGYQQPSQSRQSSRLTSNPGLALGAGLAAGALGGLVLGEVVEHMEERSAEQGAAEALEEAGYYDDEY